MINIPAASTTWGFVISHQNYPHTEEARESRPVEGHYRPSSSRTKTLQTQQRSFCAAVWWAAWANIVYAFILHFYCPWSPTTTDSQQHSSTFSITVLYSCLALLPSPFHKQLCSDSWFPAGTTWRASYALLCWWVNGWAYAWSHVLCYLGMLSRIVVSWALAASGPSSACQTTSWKSVHSRFWGIFWMGLAWANPLVLLHYRANTVDEIQFQNCLHPFKSSV